MVLNGHSHLDKLHVKACSVSNMEVDPSEIAVTGFRVHCLRESAGFASFEFEWT